MEHKFYPGSTLGIIGSSISAAMLAQSAGRLGYRVASLVTDANNLVRQFASWQTVTESYDESALRYFAGRVDMVIVEASLLSIQSYRILEELTEVFLTEDVMAISTDRLIEKAYLDSKRCLVTPFSMVTTLGDIQEAVEYIGFPCFLKTTQRHLMYSDEHLILYSEEDYDAAQAKLEHGTCILEAWIPTDQKVTLTIVRNERGEMLVYPVFEVTQRGDVEGEQIRYPAEIGMELEREMTRIGQYLAEELSVIGAITIEFLVTSAGVLYINEARVGLTEAAVFTLGSMSLSLFDAVMRALVGLPLPKLYPLSEAAIALPISQLNKENVLTQFMLRTDWGFALFNPIGNDPHYLTGQVIVTGDSLVHCERQIDLTELTKIPTIE